LPKSANFDNIDVRDMSQLQKIGLTTDQENIFVTQYLMKFLVLLLYRNIEFVTMDRIINMPRALLDTNIIIHRENYKVSNHNIGHLYRWLDKLHYTKVIHPHSIKEIKKYKDKHVQENFSVKLNAYELIKVVVEPTETFLRIFTDVDKTENDKIDNSLLFYVYSGKVDLLITEDKNLINKAKKIDIEDKVLSINQFIVKETEANPDLVDYKMLAVKREFFGNIDLSASFFDTFKKDYKEFASWFSKKFEEEAYICKDDKNDILGFLYLKTEGANENYDTVADSFQTNTLYQLHQYSRITINTSQWSFKSV
jgi:predicted nucleic acid-binding protein